MIPFARIVKYGNILPVKDIVKFDTSYSSMYILYSTGELYGRGRNSYSQMGTGDNTTVLSWKLISTDCSYFWISKDGDSSVLLRKTDGSWELSGRAYILGDTTTVYTTPTNVDDRLGVLSTGYDELYLNAQNIWYRKAGRYYRMGLNGSRNLLTGGTVALRSFTEYVLESGMKAVFPGLNGTMVSYTDGTMKAIGNNNVGLYGLPARGEYSTLTSINVPEVQSVRYRSNATFMYTVDGTYVSGNCMYGQLANGVTDTNTYVLTPIKFTATNNSVLENYEGCTVVYIDGAFKSCGVQRRVGNGPSSGNATSLVYAPNILSTDVYLNTSASYYILNAELYGCGDPSTYQLLPGYSGTQSNYVKLELP